jgi:hypothetical protein
LTYLGLSDSIFANAGPSVGHISQDRYGRMFCT